MSGIGVLVYHLGRLCILEWDPQPLRDENAMPQMLVSYWAVSQPMTKERITAWLEPGSWINPAGHASTWERREIEKQRDGWRYDNHLTFSCVDGPIAFQMVDHQAPVIRHTARYRLHSREWEQQSKGQTWKPLPTRLHIFETHARFEMCIKDKWQLYGSAIWLPHHPKTA